MSNSVRIQTPIGILTLTSNSVGLCKIQIDPPSSDSDQLDQINNLLAEAKTQLFEYFSGTRKKFDLPLDLDQLLGFQKEVLKIVSQIPYGKVLTYGQIAAQLLKPSASRAVGTALAHNPLPIIIPCHRVVATDGHLAGYLGKKGVAAKKWLLEMEGHKIVGEKLV